MKRAILSIVILVTSGVMLTSCGGGSNSTAQPSKLNKRVFVSNSFSGLVQIVDYTKDAETFNSVISTGSQPQMMVLSPDRSITLVFDGGSNTVFVVDNKSEAPKGSITLPAATGSIVISPDSKTAYAATRNAPVSGAQTGAVQVLDLVNMTLGSAINVPLATTLALSPDGKSLLVFTDTQGFFVNVTPPADTTTATTPVAIPLGGAAMVRPVAAAFNADGTKAYVANCGSECGGTGAAGVSVLDMTKLDLTKTPIVPPSAGDPVSVTGASTILLDGSTLYAAGTKPANGAIPAQPSVTVLTTSGNTVTVSKEATIGLGFHTSMVLGADNKLFIGATGCPDASGAVGQGCLAMFDTTTSADVKITAGGKGPVTGMAAIPNRSVVYVVEGGELDIYDTKTRDIQKAPCPGAKCFIDIFGRAFDVKVIDQ